MHVLAYMVSFQRERLQDYTALEQIDFRCFLIVTCDNTAALPCKLYC